MTKFEMREAGPAGKIPEARKQFWREAPPGYTRAVQRTPASMGITFPVPSIFCPSVPFELKRGSSLSLAIVDSRQEDAAKKRKAENAEMTKSRSNEGDVPDWCEDTEEGKAALKQKMKGEVIEVVDELREKGQAERRFKVPYKAYWQ